MRLAAVVGAHHDDRVVVHAVAFQLIDHVLDDVVSEGHHSLDDAALVVGLIRIHVEVLGRSL